MKKLLTAVLALCMGVFAVAQTAFYVYKADKSILKFAVSDVDSISFVEPVGPTTGTADGHEWVDLGLPSGLKWATCNVGATTPEAYGDYFAWGEIAPKETYSWATYKHGTSRDNMTKYNATDGLTVLEPDDDAATANWGGAWRMPTIGEWQELVDNCDWTWITLNGVNGYEVKSKTNGNGIFLPAAGFRYDSDLDNAGYYGYYWSSSLCTDDPSYALDVDFGSDVYGGYGRRYYGRSVRPVLK